MGAGEARFGGVHPGLERQRSGHGRHHGLIAVLADADFDALCEVDAVDGLQKAVDEVLPRLLAVGDDVDAGVFLLLDGDERGVEFGGLKLRSGESPWRPQLAGLGKP